MSAQHIEGRTRRNVWLIAAAVTVWLACLIVADRMLSETSGAAAALIAAVPLLFGLFVLWLYVNWIRNLDELGSRVQLNALAVGFGVLTLATMAYPILELLGAPELGVQGYVVFGWLAYFGSLLYSTLRYN